MKGWIIVGQAGQMDCHILFKDKTDAERSLNMPHPDADRKLVLLKESPGNEVHNDAL
jgi:hypothetical protein